MYIDAYASKGKCIFRLIEECIHTCTHCEITFKDLAFFLDTPSITAKLINEQKEDKEKKNHEEKEKMKADNGFQDNYSVVVASGAVYPRFYIFPGSYQSNQIPFI